MKKIKSIILIFLTLCIGALSGCGGQYDLRQYYGYFGTVTNVVASREYVSAEIEKVLFDVDEALGSGEGSDVTRYNALEGGKRLEITKLTYDVLMLAKGAYERTNGAYNPAVGLLADLWGFTPRFYANDYAPVEAYDRLTPSVPSGKYITAFSSHEMLDFGAVLLSHEEGKYYVTKPTASVVVDGVTYYTKIDLGGIAKGYATDECRNVLRAQGVTSAYVSVGRSSLWLGEKSGDACDGGAWNVKVNSPRGTGDFLTVRAKNVCMSTSGDYERCFFENGVRYHHILNPFTGYPTPLTASVTVVGASAAECDAYSTAYAVMGCDEALSRAERDGYTVFYSEQGEDVWTNADGATYSVGEGVTAHYVN